MTTRDCTEDLTWTSSEHAWCTSFARRPGELLYYFMRPGRGSIGVGHLVGRCTFSSGREAPDTLNVGARAVRCFGGKQVRLEQTWAWQPCATISVSHRTNSCKRSLYHCDKVWVEWGHHWRGTPAKRSAQSGQHICYRFGGKRFGHAMCHWQHLPAP